MYHETIKNDHENDHKKAAFLRAANCLAFFESLDPHSDFFLFLGGSGSHLVLKFLDHILLGLVVTVHRISVAAYVVIGYIKDKDKK